MMLYSKSTRGFYDPNIHGDNVPADAVDESKWAISYQDLLTGQDAGKAIAADDAGKPILVDRISPAETDEDRKVRINGPIIAQLAALDAATVRPLRAIAAGTATQSDRDKLASLDTEAAALRAKLIA